MDLRERVAVVTGAAGGLGRVLAADLGRGGARLGLVGAHLERLEAVAAELGLPAERTLTLAADLRDPDAAESAVAAVVERFGRLDILAHVVGGWTGGTSVLDTPRDKFAAMLDQHFWTTLNVTRAAVPRMTAGGWGRIVAVSSPLASSPTARMSAYAAGKAAQETLLVTLARELAGSGTTVNVLQVRTIDVKHERDGAPTERNASWTTPEEISAAFAWLLTDEAAVVNGARIPLFGG
ncbi:MAG: 3-oxoacyl-[acyl-carrier protein] reductase [Chloroflexi bacterium]|nr:3-oxoacyl-[acyl-carrier protein] reductase [Chloroflexota bacterium]